MSAANSTSDINQVKQLLDNLKFSFLEALPERCNEQDILVLALEGLDETEFTEVYDELYRNIHSLKGSAGTHGIQLISTICHHLEEQLEGLNGQTSKVDNKFVSHCLHYLDLIRRAGVEAATDTPDFQPIIVELDSNFKQTTVIKKRALIVESSTAMASLYSDALSELPIEITIVTDGLEALKLLLKNRYSFIVTSKSLKTLNGAALVSALKTSESANCNIKTIMISSSEHIKFRRGSRPDCLIQRNEKMIEKLLSIVTEIIQ